MRDQILTICNLPRVPSWVPEAVVHYLAHIESGTSIRALARCSGRHASTVLRQIRAFETRRDDLLVDEALRRLGENVGDAVPAGSPKSETLMTIEIDRKPQDDTTLSDARLRKEARRVLRRLCETGALLAVAGEMDKAVVVRETDAEGPARVAVVDREVAEALALKAWISCDAPGRISRYHITSKGRAALGRMLADEENAASRRSGAAPLDEDTDGEGGAGVRRMRYGMGDTPLAALARRQDRDGTPFLSPGLVRAGERLREDFELAGQAPPAAQNWDNFLAHVDQGGGGVSAVQSHGAEAARTRLVSALRDLGPGLGDVVLRCCCYLEGLETAEKKMGWSARSGKIVLRIALHRLKRHYERLGARDSMIG